MPETLGLKKMGIQSSKKLISELLNKSRQEVKMIVNLLTGRKNESL